MESTENNTAFSRLGYGVYPLFVRSHRYKAGQGCHYHWKTDRNIILLSLSVFTYMVVCTSD